MKHRSATDSLRPGQLDRMISKIKDTKLDRPKGDGMTEAELKRIVDEQVEDEGLWFNAETGPEEYLQRELRRLHAAVELYLTRVSRSGD